MATVSTSTELRVERDYVASAQADFDAYFSMHGDQRPDWIVDSQLDLRVGGTWKVRSSILRDTSPTR